MRQLLSVVMPTRNRAASARLAAASVLGQDVELELVIVDDNSDDDTAASLEELAAGDRRVRVVRPEAGTGPLGPCLARNLGIGETRGELLSFCDDDDSWTPGTGRTMVEFLGERREVVVASSWHTVDHVELGTTATFRGPTEYGSRHLLWQNFVALPFGVVRRAAVPFDISFDPGLPTGEDWDLWLRCSRHGAVRTLPFVGYVYSQHGGARVTRTATAQVEGRRGFLTKHGDAMTPTCRLYHEVVLAGLEHGRAGAVARLRHSALRTPGRASAVGALLGASALFSRSGQRAGDPGRQARRMAAMVGRLERGR